MEEESKNQTGECNEKPKPPETRYKLTKLPGKQDTSILPHFFGLGVPAKDLKPGEVTANLKDVATNRFWLNDVYNNHKNSTHGLESMREVQKQPVNRTRGAFRSDLESFSSKTFLGYQKSPVNSKTGVTGNVVGPSQWQAMDKRANVVAQSFYSATNDKNFYYTLLALSVLGIFIYMINKE